ncbi:hypothetical protein ACHAQA_009530 [Verticillium albo-atrum]
MAGRWHVPKCLGAMVAVDALALLAKLSIKYRTDAPGKMQVTGGYHNMGSDWAAVNPILWTLACWLLAIGMFILATSVIEGCEASILEYEEFALTKGLRLRPIFRSRLPLWRRLHPALRKAAFALGGLVCVAATSGTFGLPWGATTITMGPSYPISALNETFYYGLSEEVIANPHRPPGPEYTVQNVPVPDFLGSSALYLPAEQLEELDNLLEKSSKRLTKIHFPRRRPLRRRRRLPDGSIEYDQPEEEEEEETPFRLGNTIFDNTGTEGVGFNIDTFFSGLDTARLGVSSYLKPRHIVGRMYSTNVSTTCHDVTMQYSFREWNIRPDSLAFERRDSFAAFDLWKQQEPQTPASQTEGEGKGQRGNDHGSMGTSFYVMYTGGGTRNMYTAVQVFFFQQASPRVIECAYAVSEFVRAAVVYGPAEPVNGAPWISGGQCLDGLFAYPPAAAINYLLQREDNGFARAGLEWSPRLRTLLEAILGEAAQGYYSLVRQRVDRADVRLTVDQLADERAQWKTVLIMLPDDLRTWLHLFSEWVLKLTKRALQLQALRVFLPDFFRWFACITVVGYETVAVTGDEEMGEKGCEKSSEKGGEKEGEKKGEKCGEKGKPEPVTEKQVSEEKV